MAVAESRREERCSPKVQAVPKLELFYLEGLLRTTHYPSGRTGSRSSNPSGRTGSRSSNPSGRTGSRTGSRTCSPFRSPHPRFSRTGSRTGIFDVWFLICSYCLFWTCSPSRSHPPRVSLLGPVRGADPGHPRSRREEQLAFGLGFNVVYDVTDVPTSLETFLWRLSQPTKTLGTRCLGGATPEA